MKKLLLVVLAIAASASLAAAAQETDCYGWEDNGVVLGAYLPEYMTTVNDGAVAYLGTHSLEVRESGPVYTSTPQAYVAWITNIKEGDVITATVHTYDPSLSANPSCRIWSHWTTVGGDINSYYASIGGNNTYSGGTSWVPLSYSITVDAAHVGMGIVIEIRPYNGTTGVGSNWVDNLCIDHPDHCLVHFPGGPVPAEDTSWGAVKTLYQ